MLCLLFLLFTLQLIQADSKADSESMEFDADEDQSQDGRRRHHGKNPLRIRNDYALRLDQKPNLRIRGGNTTDTLNYPYMAAIIINGRMWCAGAIVDENWVITAAHCLNYVLHVSPIKSLGKYIKIRVGSSKPHEGGQLVDVVGAVRHPKFEEEPVPHADVALLKLAENLEFNKYVHLIKIYDGIKEPFAQSFIVVSGWGALRGSDTAFRDHTPDLLTARLKVRTQHYCIDAYQLVNGFQFTEDFFCASLRNGTRDVCLFDAGAPAVQQNYLMGIMSFGPERCGHEYQPAVFIKAFYFRDFVKSTIAAYKSTADLLAAMQSVDPGEDVRHQRLQYVAQEMNEVTLPDTKHD
ncbi:putative trypsin-6 [Amyelois transitella]|uniref:putative trypsin-6 n=1 Tax=Amyelois transitella TaxID=680683 RepID=UPI0029905AEE|nr:putative trypsin-6 [Amyelois transitella]